MRTGWHSTLRKRPKGLVPREAPAALPGVPAVANVDIHGGVSVEALLDEPVRRWRRLAARLVRNNFGFLLGDPAADLVELVAEVGVDDAEAS